MYPQFKYNIVVNQISNESLCCSNKYNWCICTCICKLYAQLLTFLINLTEKRIILLEIFWVSQFKLLWNWAQVFKNSLWNLIIIFLLYLINTTACITTSNSFYLSLTVGLLKQTWTFLYFCKISGILILLFFVFVFFL